MTGVQTCALPIWGGKKKQKKHVFRLVGALKERIFLQGFWGVRGGGKGVSAVPNSISPYYSTLSPVCVLDGGLWVPERITQDPL